MNEAKVELGRRLFHDPRLSVNGTQSCASCHLQALAFTDGRVTAIGATGQVGKRNSPSIANAGYAAALTWASSVLLSLESQALVPLFGEDPVELGLSGQDGPMLARLAADPDYPPRFAAAFPEEPVAISVETVVKALSAFQRTVISGRAPYDRFAGGADPAALGPAARRGLDLFRSARLGCAACHAGPLFMDSARSETAPASRPAFHNTGLYDEDGQGAYPATDHGLLELTGDPADMGRFRAPSLRNVALTAPYMHDGSVATLSEVLDHYAAGGRSTLARGAPSPLRDPLVTGFTLAADERADLLAFLEALTDEALLADPRFGPP
jgi:cytochrome c peroxidase